jgi:hypothetical protein
MNSRDVLKPINVEMMESALTDLGMKVDKQRGAHGVPFRPGHWHP